MEKYNDEINKSHTVEVLKPLAVAKTLNDLRDVLISSCFESHKIVSSNDPKSFEMKRKLLRTIN